MACPYGRLYNREAAVQALLRRMESGAAASAGDKGPEPDIGFHVRGLKDLYPVRFQVIEKDGGNSSGSKYAAVCPLTGVEINGSSPAILIVKEKAPKKKKAPKSKMVCSGKGRKGHKGDGQGRPGVTYAGAGCKK